MADHASLTRLPPQHSYSQHSFVTSLSRFLLKDRNDVDVIELGYRKLAAKFIKSAQRTKSPELADTYLVLARHYEALAKMHAKHPNVAPASSSVPLRERDDSDCAT
jgi:hypothetical protein